MGTLYNRDEQKTSRQYLRNHMTRAEIVLWYNLKGRQMLGCKFRRQHGGAQYILDFYCPELRLAIDVDGASHDAFYGFRMRKSWERLMTCCTQFMLKL